MIFTRVATFALGALPILAAATPLATRDNCSTGPVQCCQSTEKANSAAGSMILGLLGIVLQDLDVVLGLNCSPITVIGVGTGAACSAEAVCCQNNNVGGLISIGCVPVSL
ncbi:hydrophobin 1 [Trametes coccinea BRFM310]|uniref:Hydrophobin n=1 Tax=Trametes coccinea (strain BRFM310) TaxID=1353009 RepID=A0A1Y2J3P7_TRAC3|nr:hydrophobin 1 [Trametes coccinea BRFM310]